MIENGPLGRLFGADRLERVVADPRPLNRAFEATLPRAMFVLLPVFALLTNLAWRKAQPRYPTHLYVALHIHSAIFGAFLVITIAVGLIPSAAIAALVGYVFLGYVLWYGLTALHRVFGDTWPVTIVKASAVGIIYWICFFVVGFAFLAYAISRL